MGLGGHGQAVPRAAARAGDRDRLVEDIRAVAEAAHEKGAAGAGGALLKVIVETALLDDDAIVLACEAAVEAGADFVKTSTGFSTAGATAEHVALMRRTVGPGIGVKASGGVRDVDTLLAMLAEGVTRIGTSSTAGLLAEARERLAAGTLVVPEPADALDTPEPDSLY